MKTATEIRSIIESEVRGRTNLSNAHGVDLARCLVEPHLVKVRTDMNSDLVSSMWLVLEEDPTEHKGYKILYDENKNNYGLAIMPINEDFLLFLGYFGTFVETLENM